MSTLKKICLNKFCHIVANSDLEPLCNVYIWEFEFNFMIIVDLFATKKCSFDIARYSVLKGRQGSQCDTSSNFVCWIFKEFADMRHMYGSKKEMQE